MKQQWIALCLVAILLGDGLLASTAQAQAKAAIKELNAVWEYATPQDLPQAVVEDSLHRPVLFVAMKQGGLAVLDITAKKLPPQELARLPIARLQQLHVMHLAQSGEHLFLALGDFFDAKGSAAGLAVVNVKDARSPRLVAFWKSDERLQGSATILVEDGRAYLGAMSAGVMIFDVSHVERMERLALYQPDVHFPTPNPKAVHHPNARGLAKRGDRLFVAYDAGGLRVLDVSQPREPKEIGRYVNPRFPNKPQAFNNLVLDGNRAYVAVDYAGLEVLDIQNPRDIKQLGWWNPWRADSITNVWFNSPGHTNQIAWQSAKKQVWLSAGDSELQVVDVAIPTQPKLAAKFGAIQDQRGAWGVTLAGQRAYLTYIHAVVPFRSTWSGIKAVE